MNNKVKTVLRWVFGILLAGLSLVMLLAFIFTATAKDAYGQPQVKIEAAGAIIWWVVILGAGVPAVLLLRKAFQAFFAKPPRPAATPPQRGIEEPAEANDVESDSDEE